MDKKLDYDIIYKIYFYLDNYQDVCNMFLLDKFFLQNYLYRYKGPYKHKFRIIFNNIFRFLNLLQNTNLTIYDIHFLIGSDDPTFKTVVKNDIYKIYEIYKNSLKREIRGWVNDAYLMTSGLSIINLILTQGQYNIDRFVKIEFNKKIKNSNENTIGPSCNIKLTIDQDMRIVWPETINKYLLLSYNFDTFEEFFQ